MERQTISKWKFICNYFQKLDYFSVQYSFRLDNQNAYKSYLGAAMFLIYLLFSVLYFSVTFSQFLEGKNYTVNYSIIADRKPKIKLDKFLFEIDNAYNFSYLRE